MGDDKRLLYRLRNDGTSWAQPLFDEAADQIEDLQREVDQWVRNSAVWQRRIEQLERRIDAARKQENYTQARLKHAQHQIEKMRAALEAIARECSSFPIRDGLAFRCESYARAALPDGAYGPA